MVLLVHSPWSSEHPVYKWIARIGGAAHMEIQPDKKGGKDPPSPR